MRTGRDGAGKLTGPSRKTRVTTEGEEATRVDTTTKIGKGGGAKREQIYKREVSTAFKTGYNKFWEDRSKEVKFIQIKRRYVLEENQYTWQQERWISKRQSQDAKD